MEENYIYIYERTVSDKTDVVYFWKWEDSYAHWSDSVNISKEFLMGCGLSFDDNGQPQNKEYALSVQEIEGECAIWHYYPVKRKDLGYIFLSVRREKLY